MSFYPFYFKEEKYISDFIYTRQDLSDMQAWSLDRKMQVTQAKLMEWYLRNEGKVYLSFSGGKDSTVLLDQMAHLCSVMGWKIDVVFVDTGLEYPEIREFVYFYMDYINNKYSIDLTLTVLRPDIPFKQVIETFGYPVISKEVAKLIDGVRNSKNHKQGYLNRLQGGDSKGVPNTYCARFKKWEYLLEAPFEISPKCCLYLKEKPIAIYAKKTKNVGIVATMANESFIRQRAWLITGCNSFKKTRKISKPISFWAEQDILSYIRKYDVPISKIYGEVVAKNAQESLFNEELTLTGVKRTGCMFCMFGVHLEKEPNRFQAMYHSHPKLYEYCIYKLGLHKILDYIGVSYQPM